MKERSRRPGGFFRSIRRFKENQQSARRAEQEIKDFQKSIGEPSEAFFPPYQAEPDTVGHIVFVSPGQSEAVSSIRFQLEGFLSKNEPLSSA